MYAAMEAESSAVAAYFFVIIVIFAFVVVNLFIAVITTAFQNIRRKRDKEAQIQQLRLGQLKLIEDAKSQAHGADQKVDIDEQRKLAAASVAYTSKREQVEILLESGDMGQYLSTVLELVDCIEDLEQVTKEDLEARGIKAAHANRIKDVAARYRLRIA